MEPEQTDPHQGWGFQWRPGQSPPGPLGQVGVPVAPSCAGCARPVGWPELRWRVVWRQPGRVAVEADGPEWHRSCRRRQAWRGFTAAVGEARDAGVVAGIAVGQALLPLAWFVGPAAVGQSRAVVAAAGTLAGVVADDTRRQLRRVGVERVARPVGHGIGEALAVVLDAGGRAARVVERGRFEFHDSVAEARQVARHVRSGGVGVAGAWRQLRDRWWLRSERLNRQRFDDRVDEGVDEGVDGGYRVVAQVPGDGGVVESIAGWLGRPAAGQAAADGSAEQATAVVDGNGAELWTGDAPDYTDDAGGVTDEGIGTYHRVTFHWPDGWFDGHRPGDGRWADAKGDH